MKSESKVVTRRKLVIPHNINALMDRIGPTRTAERLGVSTTLLHKARKDNAVNRVVEVAAGYALEHLGDKPHAQPSPPETVRHDGAMKVPAAANKAEDDLFLVSVPHSRAAALGKLAERLGAELVAA